MKLRIVIFGRGTGTMTDMDTTQQRLARPTDGSPTPITETPVALTMDTNIAVTLDEAIEIESDTFVVAAGDTVFVSLDRLAAGTPTYDFEMGLVRAGAVIEGA